MEGQEDVAVQAGTHAEEDLDLDPDDRDRTGRALKGVDGCLADEVAVAVEAPAVEKEAHAGRELKGEEVEEVLGTVDHSTILRAGVYDRVVHCPSYLFSHTRTTQANTAGEAIWQSTMAACYRLGASTVGG